jgi:hypothetical protein
MDGTAAFDAMVSAAAFLYLATEDTDLEFESVLAEGINVAEAKRDRRLRSHLPVADRRPASTQTRGRRDVVADRTRVLHQSDEVSMSDLAVYLHGRKESDEIDDGRIQSKVTNF